ncbi:MAG: Re/Si-specific NAD(P)(+) transhydrogenase subunit alpha [Saprospiraceae bacterium]|nr:Re/Si-specific NAD(P)(+) transhydrogenase subunit alpha [Saprospiraceae bacterium]
MILGVLKETDDRRVAVVPQVAKKLKDLGLELMIEAGAGTGAGYRDADYADLAKVVARDTLIQQADMLAVINQPDAALLDHVPAGKYLVSSFAPFMDDSVVEDLKRRSLHAFSMDMIPRTTLAQSMDVLSSMASIAGYKAVLKAADHLLKYFPMMITAAGSIKPAKVLVIGAGVAGLQAIATARRLGAVVEAFDTRSAVKEEVQSLGARFVEVEGATEDAAAGGYAVAQSEEYMRRQRELVQERARSANVIITTAQVRGRKAPVIIPADTVEHMQPGSVIVDLAASTGGNCALTQNDQVINHNGVTIIGDSDLAGDMPQDASFLYANNLLNLLKIMIKDGELALDLENEIISSACITK